MTKRRTFQNGPRAIRHCFPFLAVIVAMWLASPLSSSLAQRDYFPSRPITIVIPFTPGGRGIWTNCQGGDTRFSCLAIQFRKTEPLAQSTEPSQTTGSLETGAPHPSLAIN